MFQDLNPLDRSTAILEIAILLLIAAIIGFITAWLYYRRIYRAKIAELEREFADYRATHVPQEELHQAEKALAEMTEERNILRVELASAQNLVRATEEELKTTRLERDRYRNENILLAGKLAEANTNLAQCNTAQEKLSAQFSAVSAENERLETRTTDLVTQLEEARTETARLEAELELCRNKDGAATPATKARTSKTSRIARKSTPANKKQAALDKVRAQRGTINFERLGVADASQADDLKEIKGIGPFIEEKLNALGIYTFAQIANFLAEDVEAVTKAIAFFPGRITRDNWVDQAAEKSQS